MCEALPAPTCDFPLPTANASKEGEWTEVFAGGGHSCATKKTGLWCWGDNQAGEAGIGTTEAFVAAPAMIHAGMFDDVALSTAFPGHTCGITSGQVWCWGDNAEGQLGHVPLNARLPSIVDLGELAQVDVCAGDRHTCAIDDERQLRCWGDNSRGQLGDGTVESRGPVDPEAVGDWGAVSCGGEHTCAIDGQNGLYCWGRNQEGQLGTGKETPAEPVAVVPFSP
jgi:alpha-tubulin suppressor-like RCC1 family protein